MSQFKIIGSINFREKNKFVKLCFLNMSNHFFSYYKM